MQEGDPGALRMWLLVTSTQRPRADARVPLPGNRLGVCGAPLAAVRLVLLHFCEEA